MYVLVIEKCIDLCFLLYFFYKKKLPNTNPHCTDYIACMHFPSFDQNKSIYWSLDNYAD